MNTEITDNDGGRSWIFYDGQCSLCRAWAARLQAIPALRTFGFLPLQTPWVRDRLRLDDATLLTEMRVLLPDGRVWGGAEAVVELARRIWWAWPLWAGSRIPGVLPILRAGYRFLAAHRSCLSGACALPEPLPGARTAMSARTTGSDLADKAVRAPTRLPFRVPKPSSPPRRLGWPDWLPLLLMPALALGARNALPDWVFMWLLAFAIFCGCKWLTWRLACAAGVQTNPVRAIAYLFAWPGMDAMEFLTDRANTPTEPRPGCRGRDSVHSSRSEIGNRKSKISEARVWVFAAAKTLAGAGLFWFAARHAATMTPLVAGWLGMIAIVLLLHFGLFHGLALLWQRAGIAARPVMRSPLLASSLANFWSERWNTAFNNLACDLAYRPLARRVGSAPAMLGVFLISGLIHDLVISLPARGGYGWPTAYFLLQGAAVLFERSRTGRALGLGRGRRGWLFTLMVTAAPAFWLFHPLFIHNIILPMLQAIGATWNTP